MQEKFNLINEKYKGFEKSLLKSGRMPLWDTGVGFWSSAVLSEVFELFKKVRLGRYKNFIDLGSGDGRVVLLASLFTNATGVEADKNLHNYADRMRHHLGIKNASFINKNFYHHDIRKHDIVFINPDAPFHRGLETKMFNELRGRLLVYSNHFHPEFMKKVADLKIGGAKLYSIV